MFANMELMVDAAQGDVITVPESELATWTIPDGATVNSAYVEFEATVDNTFSIKWIIDANETIQSYHPGDAVSPPSAIKDGYIFTGWMPAAPTVMWYAKPLKKTVPIRLPALHTSRIDSNRHDTKKLVQSQILCKHQNVM